MFGKTCVRRLSSLAEPLSKLSHGRYPVPTSPRYKKLMEQQTRFCRDDGLLVWQKNPADVSMYRATVVLAAFGLLFSVAGLCKLISPPKNQ